MSVVISKGPRNLTTVKKAIEEPGGLDRIASSFDRALIKVNFITDKTWDSGATTDPLLVEGLVTSAQEVFKEVYVVETDASTTNAEKAYVITGVKAVCERLGVQFLNLRHENSQVELQIAHPETVSRIKVAEIVTNSAIISAAKMKTHSVTGVTLGLKNMFGLLSTKAKFKYHFKNMDKVISDICSVLTPHFSIIDGFIAMEGNGPVKGTPVNMGVIVSGFDPVAVDATTSRVMGFNPNDILHILKSHRRGLGEIEEERINILGSTIQEVFRNFKKPRSWSPKSHRD
jgi:uncharacterized protein (DUF362 family)